MIYLIGAVALSLLSVRALNQSHKIYVEESGLVARTVAILYAVVGLGSVLFAYHAVTQFLEILNGR